MKQESSDTLGIHIKKTEFDHLIKKYSASIKNNSYLNIDDYVAIVRLINTIEKNDMFEDYKGFRELFYPDILNKSIEVLEASFWKGGCQYSEKYDLFIGGSPHSNSQYKIID